MKRNVFGNLMKKKKLNTYRNILKYQRRQQVECRRSSKGNCFGFRKSHNNATAHTITRNRGLEWALETRVGCWPPLNTNWLRPKSIVNDFYESGCSPIWRISRSMMKVDCPIESDLANHVHRLRHPRCQYSVIPCAVSGRRRQRKTFQNEDIVNASLNIESRMPLFNQHFKTINGCGFISLRSSSCTWTWCRLVWRLRRRRHVKWRSFTRAAKDESTQTANNGSLEMSNRHSTRFR